MQRESNGLEERDALAVTYAIETFITESKQELGQKKKRLNNLIRMVGPRKLRTQKSTRPSTIIVDQRSASVDKRAPSTNYRISARRRTSSAVQWRQNMNRLGFGKAYITVIENQKDQYKDHFSDTLRLCSKLFQEKEYKRVITLIDALIEDSIDSGKAEQVEELLYIGGLAASYISSHKHTVKFLSLLNKANPFYSAKVYLLLSQSLVVTKRFSDAIKVLDKGSSSFDNFIDSFIYKGRIHQMLKDHKRAVFEFQKALSVDSANRSALLGIAESFRMMRFYCRAFAYLSYTMKLYPDYRSAELSEKRVECSLHLGELTIAEKDLEKTDHESIYAQFLKGKMYAMQGKLEDARSILEFIVHLSKAGALIINKAIFWVTILKCKENDYYGALHTIKNIENAPEYYSPLELLINAAISTIKQKYEESIELIDSLFSQIDKEDRVRNEESIEINLLNSMLGFKAYSLIMLGKSDRAISAFALLETKQSLAPHDEFNYFLGKAIEAVRSKEYEESLKMLERVKGLGLSPLSTSCTSALFTLTSMINEAGTASYLESESMRASECKIKPYLQNQILETIEVLDAYGISCDTADDLCFISGFLKLIIQEPIEAIKSFSLAIEKALAHHPLHYLYKGIAFMYLGDYGSALKDLKIAINIDPTSVFVYTQIGRCYLGLGNLKKAIRNFQRNSGIEEIQFEVDYLIGSFFLDEGMYKQAIELFETSLNVKKTRRCTFALYKAYISTNNLQKASQTLKRLNIQDCFYPESRVLEALRAIAFDNNIDRAWTMLYDLYDRGLYQEGTIVFENHHIPLYLSGIAASKGHYREAGSFAVESQKAGYRNSSREWDISVIISIYRIAQGEVSTVELNNLKILMIDYPDIISPLSKLLKIANSSESEKETIHFLDSKDSFFPPILLNGKVKIYLPITLPVTNPQGLPFELGKNELRMFELDWMKIRLEAPWTKKVAGEFSYTNRITEDESNENVLDDSSSEVEEEEEYEEDLPESEALIKYN